jgi:TRAP transporter TAXI family solute receptor
MHGKRVAVGTPGASQRIMIQEALEGYGMTFKDFIPYDLNYGEAADQMKDGLMDVVFCAGGIPNATMVDLTFSTSTNLISVDDDVIQLLVKKHAFYNADSIPPGMYAEYGAKTFGLMNSLVCDESVDDDVVYEITKLLYDNLEYMTKVHAICSKITAENAVSGYQDLFPMHPGALRYWKEIGVIN